MEIISTVSTRKFKPRVFKPRKASKKPLKRKKGHTFNGDTLVKIWSLKKADRVFSEEIRKRDGKCLFPNCHATANLTCSHYFGRATKATRYDPDNCITLCGVHHFWNKMLGWEFQKQREEEHGWDGRYTLYMKETLGAEKWLKLKEKAATSIKQKDAIIAYQFTYTNRSQGGQA